MEGQRQRTHLGQLLGRLRRRLRLRSVVMGLARKGTVWKGGVEAAKAMGGLGHRCEEMWWRAVAACSTAHRAVVARREVCDCRDALRRWRWCGGVRK
ncbi:hypothetical protein GUJ93_ZPchr0006g41145 [Zizania palustris]|uniref:Uncharacterized protein n=1 Tax=Zizania palustris TaxID=103762 RepID=A0A8J5VQS0_ZIZPA|nr:hypothetical protein GUJ93_ZPchr0006g41145 [Zizania palustris]